jgi:hypothetical protein
MGDGTRGGAGHDCRDGAGQCRNCPADRRTGIVQLRTPVGPEHNLAAIVDLPDRLADSALPRRGASALIDLAAELGRSYVSFDGGTSV